MSFDFLNKKKKIREAEEKARMEEERERAERERAEREKAERERARRRAERENARRTEEQQQNSRLTGEIIDIHSIIREGDIVKYNADLITESIERYYTSGVSWFYFNGELINIPQYPEIAVITTLCNIYYGIIAEMQIKVTEVHKAHNMLIQKQAELANMLNNNEFYNKKDDVCDFCWNDMKEEIAKANPEIVLQVTERVDEFKIFAIRKVFSEYVEDIGRCAAHINCETRQFFSDHNFLKTHETLCGDLKSSVYHIKEVISKIKEANNALAKEVPDDNKMSLITEVEHQTLPDLESKVERFITFSQRVRVLSFSKMMDEKNYGRINKIYWDVVHGMTRTDALKYISTCEQHINNAHVEGIYAIDIEKVMRCVWFFASEKPFSALDFQKAKSVFQQIYKQGHVDVTIADLYAKKTVGGENALREPVRDMLKQQVDARTLTLIASSFMWMNAYQTEHIVLQHMLATGKEMTAKTQERLHSLTNGGGKAPSGFEAKSHSGALYFDLSALAWRDDEYTGLFENLAFQDKNLTYSLAIRSENKELFIPQGINIPKNDEVLRKLKSVFEEEYGESVLIQSLDCIALSGSGEERLKGIVAISDDCKQMGILMHMVRIGKKLIIRFYTLFVPTGSNLATQKQQALSIYKNLSLSVSMWESSLKDTMLMAMEQLLNSANQSDNNAHTANVHSGVCDEPVF